MVSHNALPPRPARARDRHHWTTREVDILRELYPRAGLAPCLARLPRRSAGSIYQKARVLGLRAPQSDNLPAARTRWAASPAIDEHIRRVYQAAPRKNAINELARRLGRPRSWVYRRAVKLGCVVPRFDQPRWSAAEEALVEKHAHKTPAVVARVLKAHGFARSAGAVCNKVKRLNLDTQDPDRYTGAGLAALMGVAPGTVGRWIERGWLKAKRRGTGRVQTQGGDHWWVHRREVRRFAIENAAAVDLRKVDKFWFIDLMARP